MQHLKILWKGNNHHLKKRMEGCDTYAEMLEHYLDDMTKKILEDFS